jgi:signal transduction histidine kinase
LAEVLQGMAESLRSDPDQPEIDLASHRVEVLADRARVLTSVRAMVRAAAWWGREGPIRLAVRPGVDDAAVEVLRRGPDLDPTDVETLFEAGLSGPGGGVRLGLFVARGVAQAHGGSLSADVSDDLRLTLSLPVP